MVFFGCFGCCGSPKIIDEEEADPLIVPPRQQDANLLHVSLEANPPRKNVIIDLLANRTPSEIEEIADLYQKKSGKPLSDSITFKFKEKEFIRLASGLVSPHDYDARLLNTAFNEYKPFHDNLDETLINEIILTKSSSDLAKLQSAYERIFGLKLKTKIEKNIGGKYGQFLIKLLEGNAYTVKVEDDVKAIFEAGESRLGANAQTFIDIFTTRSHAHLRQVFLEYPTKTSKKSELLQVVKSEFSGDFEQVLVDFINIVLDRSGYIATVFKKDGGIERGLIRYAKVSGWEEVKMAYFVRYNEALLDKVTKNANGEYKKLLVDLMNGLP